MLINLWSGPRCVSTALMYSFGQRTDLQVFDEPLYAAYLRVSGVWRPYRDKVLEAQENDGEKVMLMLQEHAQDKHVFAKQMGKFVSVIQSKWLREGVHIVLVRDPIGVVNSFSEVAEATLEETCYPALCRIVSELRSAGKKPVVVLSEDLVNRPEATLRALCKSIGLPFDSSMMRWSPGPKPYDGVWASHWYRNAHNSSGWSEPTDRERVHVEIAEDKKALLNECYAMHALLLPYALMPEEMGPLPPVSAAQPDQGGIERVVSTAPHDCEKSTSSTHSYAPDKRNADILVGIRDGVSRRFSLEWRPVAKVSVLDAGFLLGDGVWEGFRVHKGVVMFIQEHFARLFQGAKALDMHLDFSPAQLSHMLYRCLDANGMRHASGVHVRLMVTRGLKPTPYQNPRCIIGHPTVVIIPEWKEASSEVQKKGLRLSTVHVRRGPADVQDQRWNSHSKLNCISACIQANHIGADEGLMLDPHGFVATCNSVNFFMVERMVATIVDPEAEPVYQVVAPSGKYQLQGVTRANVLQLCFAESIPWQERDFTLTEAYSATEAFVTGSFAGILPVQSIDGRVIGNGTRGPITAALQQAYKRAMDRQADIGRVAP